MQLFLAATPAGSNYSMIIMLVLLGLFTYFAMIRPQKKAQQKRSEMINQMKKGDKVILISGLHGKIERFDDAEGIVVIDANGVLLTFSRNAISRIIPADAEQAPVDKEAEEEKAEDKE